MAGSFSVYVEGATDGDVQRLADAMAARYNIPAVQLAQRLTAGRFRVKANIDRATADTYVADLSALGARVTIEESRPSSPQYQSGLAAAFSPSDAKMDLGALGGDSGGFKLAALDGEPGEEVAPPKVSIRTPVMAPEPELPTPAKRAPTESAFAPPGAAEEAAFSVDIAPDELDYRKSKQSVPPATAPVEPLRRSSPSIPPVTMPREPSALANPRVRFAVGILLAVVIGFIPAHIVGRIREKRYAEIDAALVAQQATAVTSTQIDELDAVRAAALADKRSARTNIALVSLLVWAAVGAGVGFAWFRVTSPRARAEA